jgi:hypothetical protein
MPTSTRLRSPIVELYSGRAFPNELQASQYFNISRYHIRDSMKNSLIVRNKLREKCAFATYYFGMDIKSRLSSYFQK